MAEVELAEISVLRHDEGIRVDGRRVIELYDELGESAAELVIGRAMEELAVALQDVLTRGRSALDLWHGSDPSSGPRAEAAEGAQRLAALGWQVGLSSLAHVGSDLITCAQRGDAAAFAAVLGRLDRVGNRSLTAVWDSRDIRK